MTDQRVVVVTGGGGGIGAAIAEELGRVGWYVVTVDPLVTGARRLETNRELRVSATRSVKRYGHLPRVELPDAPRTSESKITRPRAPLTKGRAWPALRSCSPPMVMLCWAIPPSTVSGAMGIRSVALRSVPKYV